MQLKTFKMFILKVVKEGNRLQKVDINGNIITKSRFTSTQYIAFLISVCSIFLLPKGFTDNFAGYIISFLGIFIGLFTGIVIALFDKSKSLLDGYDLLDQPEKLKIKQTRNYIVIFSGLTSYGILLALVTIVLLSLCLLNEKFRIDLHHYPIVKNLSEINPQAIYRGLKVMILIIHRFFIMYFLINFFIITTYSFTSYFSYLSSEYKKLKPPQ